MNRAEKAIALLTCPRCGAAPTQQCRTKSGEEYGKWYVHQRRLDPLEEEWRKGYSDAKAYFEQMGKVP